MDFNKLARLPILNRLPQDVLEIVFRTGEVKQVRAGDILSREGAQACHVIWILSGRAKTSVENINGEETVIDIISQGAKVGLAEVCEEGAYCLSVQVLEDSVIFQLPKAEFLSLLEEQFDLQMAVFANISVEMRGAVREINDLKLKNTSRRLGAYLLGMTSAEEGEVVIDLPFGKRLLAARLAMKPESLSRALAKLKKTGVETMRNQVKIMDIEVLKNYCGEDDWLFEEGMV
ncbi:Crp/Fnr family transcriptional regulator [Terasakiella sp.]|uniref:Crp/Fnr family transcriptional regulator n=1 Tax=Terasakiella sp. TaxID=2034861 RepID=UPI003AA84211